MITDIAFELIHNFTNGVPRRINVFCDRLLLYGYLEELFVFKPEVINTVAEELAFEVRVPSKPVSALSEVAAVVESSAQPSVPVASSSSASQEVEHLELVVESLERTLQEKIGQLKKSIERLK